MGLGGVTHAEPSHQPLLKDRHVSARFCPPRDCIRQLTAITKQHDRIRAADKMLAIIFIAVVQRSETWWFVAI